MALVMLIGVGGLGGAPVWAAEPGEGAAGQAPAGEVVDPGSCPVAVRESPAEALAAAAVCGDPVEIAGTRTGTRREWAQPDGTIRAEVYVTPEWVEDGVDGWERVDLTLEEQPDGSVAPRVAADELVLSGAAPGGTEDLVSFGSGAEQVALGWWGALPEPVLAGATATYPEVRPGVDLVVEALNTGFEYHLVVKDRQAAEQLGELAVPWRDGAVEPVATVDGGVALRSAGGSVEPVVPQGAMWDSSVSPVSGEPEHRVAVDVAVEAGPTGGTDLVVDLDREFLADPETVYPVVVDPTVNPSLGFDAFVQNGWTGDQSGSPELKLGTYNGGGSKARSFLRFDGQSFYYGAEVNWAFLYLYNTWSFSCRHAGWQAWHVNHVDSTVRWTNQPPWIMKVGGTTQTWGYDACDPDNWVHVNVRDSFQQRADEGQWTTVNIGLRASEENDSDSWKRFRSANSSYARPFVEMNYTPNQKPGAPTLVKSTGDCEPSCSSGAKLRVTRPTLQAKASDPNSDHHVWVGLEVRNSSKSSVVAGTTISNKPSGSTVTWKTPTLSNGSSYHYRARAKDAYSSYGSWSGYYTFTIDTSGPGRPVGVGVSGGCDSACASPAAVRDRRPTFTATPQHTFGDRTDLVFEVFDSSKQAVVATGVVANAAAGTAASWTPPSDLPEGATMHVRVRSTSDDYGRSGGFSAWFTFTVDTSAPALPGVSSSLYAPDTWAGGVGQPGLFTFEPAGAGDVVIYQWRFSDGEISEVEVAPGASHTVSLTPPGDLEQVLQVRSIDRAGNTSGFQSYRFLVKAQPADTGYWKFDQSSGTVAPAATGSSSYDGQLHGGAGWVASGINPGDPGASGNAVLLDGASGYVEMPPILATDHPAGFSVSAWVNPDQLSGERTVVAQNGVNTYAFRLFYKPTTDQWCFGVRDADQTTAGTVNVCSAVVTPQMDVWTHLVGMYDRSVGKLRLYVNGGPFNFHAVPGSVDETDAPTHWASAGAFQVGRDIHGGYLAGRVDEVRAYQRVVAEEEARQMFQSCLDEGCPPVPDGDDLVMVGGWDFEDDGTTALDRSGLGNHGTLSGAPGTQWTAFGYRDSRAVVFDGASGWVDTPSPLPLTDRSFTVSAWARLDAFTAGEQVVAQTDGEDVSAMKLSYDPVVGGWSFGVSHWNGASSTWYGVAAAAPVQLGEWTQLVGVYDWSAGAIRLYVNGQLDGSLGGVSVQPADSGMRMGGTPGWGHLAGAIDTVRVYQGAAGDAQVADWYGQQVAPPPVAVEPVLTGDWRLDDGSGLLATDHVFGNHGFLSGGASWSPPAGAYSGRYGVAFDGSSGQVESFFPPVQTSRSFTVSAWVSLADRDEERVAVAVDGQSVAPFVLGYDDALDRFCFSMHHADVGGAELGQVTRACAGQAPVLDQWTQLVGVFDRAARTVNLYMGGGLAETVSYAGLDPWEATGALVIGRARWTPAGGSPTGPAFWWSGGVALVQAYQEAMGAAGVADLHEQQQFPVPVAVIDTPGAALEWQVGEEVGFTGHADDALGGLPAESLSWRLRLVDCTEAPCQSEVYQEWSGVAGGSFVPPDVGYPAHLELELTADNGSGVAGVTSVTLQPATVQLTFSSAPAGLELVVGVDQAAAPSVHTVIPGGSVSVSAPSPQEAGGSTYVFEGWSDAGGQDHTVTAPAVATEFVADFVASGAVTPTAVIDAPGGGVSWRAGDVVQFSGHATDSQGSLPASALAWQLWLVSCPAPGTCAAEPLADWQGVASGSFEAPDADYPSHLELELTAANGPDLSDTALVQLFPQTVDLTFDSVPSGLQLSVGDQVETAPVTRTVIQNATVAVGASSPQDLAGTSYVFDGWSDGGGQTHVIDAPSAPATYTASYQAAASLTPCGADTFGHTCQAGARPFLPAGQVLPLSGEDAVAEVGLPFTVWLYGQAYETAWVDTNGLVTFIEPEAPAPSVASIPAAYQWGEADAALYPFWFDWLVDAGASVRTELVGTEPDRQFVIEWRDVTTAADPTVRVSFQVVLYEDGRVGFAWDGIDPVPAEQGAGAVVGIENDIGSDALAYSQFTASLSAGQGVLFTPPQPGTVSGVVSDGGSGVPVFGAPVRLVPGGWTTYTDAAGGYEFLDVPVGAHAVVAARPDGRCAGADAGAVVPVTAGAAAVADVTLGSGMDEFGSTCSQGAASFLPTDTVLAQDVYFGSQEVPLPFPVWLYGQQYATVWVDVEGVVSFEEPAWDLDNVSPIPSPPEWGKANAAVYGFWNDWMVIEGASIRTGTVGTAPQRQFVIEWRDVMANEPPHPRASFQIVFHESGGISVAWDGVDPSLLGHGAEGVVGIENAEGTDALVYSQFLPAIQSGQGVWFATKGENLALGRPVSSDGGFCGAGTAPQAVNGSWTGGTDDKWCSPEGPAWLQVDLGQATGIGNVTLRHAGAGGEDPARNTADYRVQVSQDGQNWLTAVEVTGNTDDVTFHDLAVGGRYVRLDVTGPNSGVDAYARIYELEVYGQPGWGAPAPPEPTGNLAWARPVQTDGGFCGGEVGARAVNGSWTGGTGDKWCSPENSAWLRVDLGAVGGIGNVTLRHAGAGGEDPALNTQDFLLKVSEDGQNWLTVAQVAGNTADVTSHDLTVSGRYVQVDVLTPAGSGDPHARIYELEVYADPVGPPPAPPEPTGNLAWARPVVDDGGDCGVAGGGQAVNGSWTGGTGDKWCSPESPAWLQVDLGEATTIGNLTVRHAGAGGENPVWNTRDFQIQVSDDTQSWTTVVEVTGNTADVTSHDVAASGRYVRLLVLTPTSDSNQYARIYEFEVYADPAG